MGVALFAFDPEASVVWAVHFWKQMYTIPILIPAAGATNVLALAALAGNEERMGCTALQSSWFRKWSCI